MAEFKHLVVANFKEDIDVKELLKTMEQLFSEIDLVHSFEWGEDVDSHEMLRQGFTHVFLITFKTKEDFNAFNIHPKHVEFSATFAEVIDKFVLLDFPISLIKPPPPPPQPPTLEEESNPTSENKSIPTTENETIPTNEKETTNNLEDQEEATN